MKRKKTNDFEYTIFGIDLFIKYIIDKIKQKEGHKKSKKVAKAIKCDII